MEQWWKNSVVYQIYVRSFQDSNHDGIGDLQGIVSRMDYLKELGVDVIWLTPIYASPNDDNGYDISDYRSILPEYGTMKDLQDVLDAAHMRGMKIVLDLVFNHTSDEHFWFKESIKSKDNPYRNYYIWQDPNEHGDAPNNWTSCFQGSAWEYEKKSNQYYLHLFSKKQPDLNWQNPQVRKECYAIMQFWIDKGVDGFRLDVINLISKEEASFIRDSEIKGHQVCANGPNVHAYLQEMVQSIHSPNPLLLIGETPAVNIDQAIAYASNDGKELSMVFQFEVMNVDGAEENKWTDRRYNLTDLKAVLSRWQVGLHDKAWNALFWSNHDQPRAVSRFGDTSTPFYHEKSAKLLAICLHLMQGTPFIYQGEELGMSNVPFPSLSAYRDIDSLNSYHQLVEVEQSVKHEDMMRYLLKSSRDHARTPMQWSSQPNAGFSDGTPWIMVNPNYVTINAQLQQHDPDSIFATYQALIALRKTYPILVEGDYELLEESNLFVYRRTLASEEVLVICNFSKQEQSMILPHSYEKILIRNYPQTQQGRNRTLQAYEAIAFYRHIA